MSPFSGRKNQAFAKKHEEENEMRDVDPRVDREQKQQQRQGAQ